MGDTSSTNVMASLCFKLSRAKSATVLNGYVAEFIDVMDPVSKANGVDLCFAVEKAYWHHLKNTRDFLEPDTMLDFLEKMLYHIPHLGYKSEDAPLLYKRWRDYKSSIPTCGAVIFDRRLTRILLVQSGSSENWGFPKGKREQGERSEACAAREVMEETGLDIRGLINSYKYFHFEESNHFCTLYIVSGVDENVALRADCFEEISDIKWVGIETLPFYHGDDHYRHMRYGIESRKFRNIFPIVRKIVDWVRNEKEFELHRLVVEQREMAARGLPLEFCGKERR